MQLLVECFANEDDEQTEGSSYRFSSKFTELLLKVIREKLEKFQLKTLVHLIWTFAKSETLYEDPQIKGLLIEIRDNERLRASLGSLL